MMACTNVSTAIQDATVLDDIAIGPHMVNCIRKTVGRSPRMHYAAGTFVGMIHSELHSCKPSLALCFDVAPILYTGCWKALPDMAAMAKVHALQPADADHACMHACRITVVDDKCAHLQQQPYQSSQLLTTAALPIDNCCAYLLPQLCRHFALRVQGVIAGVIENEVGCLAWAIW